LLALVLIEAQKSRAYQVVAEAMLAVTWIGRRLG
jgi:hypothetical protein